MPGLFDLNEVETYDAILQVYGEMNVFSPEARDRLLQLLCRALKPGGRLTFDVTTRIARKRVGATNNWSFQQTGFWAAGPHLMLADGFDYPEQHAWVDQYVVVEPERTRVFRNWFTDYDAMEVTRFAGENGFTVVGLSGGLSMAPLTEDVCPEPEPLVEQAMSIAAGVPVIALSAVTGDGVECLAPWLIPGQTLVALGSSGAGKSTLMNRLAGEELALTQEVRADDARGRHTTTHRELFLLDSGILMLDTPGIRELQLWESDTGLEEAFADIQAIALRCRFRDCTHHNEPGCAIRMALQTGELATERYESHQKLEREMRFVTQKNTQAARVADRAFGKAVTRAQRKAVPVLPERYVTGNQVLPKVEDLFRNGDMLVAREHGRPVGVLGGWKIPQFMGDRDGLLVPEYGFGTDLLEPERVCLLFERLYGEQCARWFTAGALNHAIVTYDEERAFRDKLFHGGFGGICIDAIRPAVTLRLPVPENVRIREVRTEDMTGMRAWEILCSLHTAYMRAAPVLLGSSEETSEEELAEWIRQQGHHAWIAEGKTGEPRAYLQMEKKTTGTSMLVDARAVRG